MELIAIISIFINGVTIGILALDFGTRKRLQQSLGATLESIQGVHNQQVKQLMELSDRVTGLEIRAGSLKK